MDIKVLYRLYNIVHLSGRHDVGREKITPKSTPSDTNSLVTLVDIILRVGAPFSIETNNEKRGLLSKLCRPDDSLLLYRK